MKRTLLLVLLVALLVVPAAVGAKVKGTSSIALAGATPTYGSTITFDVFSDITAFPFVHLLCSQEGTLVAEGWQGFFATALGTQAFALYSPLWTGGAADCTADLVMSTRIGPNGPVWAEIATTSFHVDA